MDVTFALCGRTDEARAGVTLPAVGTVVRLDIAELRRRPALSTAMVALFGRELARKGADSVPMDRAARSRPVTGEVPIPSTLA